VTARYLNAQRHVGTVAEIAKVKFPFPSEEIPDMETLTNVPKARIAVGEANGKDLFPDIVVVRRPGQFLQMMAEVEMPDTLTDETALNSWAPLSKIGELFIYVPAGMVPEAKSLLKKHKISVAGIRTWRFRPVWGLDVTEA
jgi:hypothetical protein